VLRFLLNTGMMGIGGRLRSVILLALAWLPAGAALIQTEASTTTGDGVQTCVDLNPCQLTDTWATATAQTYTEPGVWGGSTLLAVSAFVQAGTVYAGPGSFTNTASANASVVDELRLFVPGVGSGFIEADVYAFHQSWGDRFGNPGGGAMSVLLAGIGFDVPSLSPPRPANTPSLTYRAAFEMGQPFTVALAASAYTSAIGQEIGVAETSMGLAALRLYDAEGNLLEPQQADPGEVPEPSGVVLTAAGLAALAWGFRRLRPTA
jgi:hypothetical protein